MANNSRGSSVRYHALSLGFLVGVGVLASVVVDIDHLIPLFYEDVSGRLFHPAFLVVGVIVFLYGLGIIITQCCRYAWSRILRDEIEMPK